MSILSDAGDIRRKGLLTFVANGWNGEAAGLVQFRTPKAHRIRDDGNWDADQREAVNRYLRDHFCDER
jgi:hypothetical protein